MTLDAPVTDGTRHPLIAALMLPENYPHPTRDIRLLETHISWVILAGEFAYKIKKPVHLGFLNFLSLKARRYYCEKELELNRRLTRDLYLDVVAIRGTPPARCRTPVTARRPGLVSSRSPRLRKKRGNGVTAISARISAIGDRAGRPPPRAPGQ